MSSLTRLVARSEVARREDRRLRAPQVLHPRVGPAHSTLVRIGGVVFLGHVVAEEDVGQRFEAVGVMTGHVERNRIVVADVLGESLAGGAVEHDDARHPLQADEQVVLAPLVIVEAADHTAMREVDVRLAGLLGQHALAAQLDEPAALVVEALQRDPEQAVDHAVNLFTPVRAISAPISASDSCVPASSHQPVTRLHASVPRSA